MALTKEQLLLPESELTQLTQALANAGYIEPFTTAGTEAEDVVATYTGAYTLGSGHAARLQRALIIHQLYSLIGAVSEAIQKAYDEAMKELRDIRDGKFPGLTDANGSTDAQTGGWGSRTKLNFPGDTTE